MKNLDHPSSHLNDEKMARFRCSASTSLDRGEGYFYFSFYSVQDCSSSPQSCHKCLRSWYFSWPTLKYTDHYTDLIHSAASWYLSYTNRYTDCVRPEEGSLYRPFYAAIPRIRKWPCVSHPGWRGYQYSKSLHATETGQPHIVHTWITDCFIMNPQALREELQRRRGSSVGSGGTVEDAERIRSLEDELERWVYFWKRSFSKNNGVENPNVTSDCVVLYFSGFAWMGTKNVQWIWSRLFCF